MTEPASTPRQPEIPPQPVAEHLSDVEAVRPPAIADVVAFIGRMGTDQDRAMALLLAQTSESPAVRGAAVALGLMGQPMGAELPPRAAQGAAALGAVATNAEANPASAQPEQPAAASTADAAPKASAEKGESAQVPAGVRPGLLGMRYKGLPKKTPQSPTQPVREKPIHVRSTEQAASPEQTAQADKAWESLGIPEDEMPSDDQIRELERIRHEAPELWNTIHGRLTGRQTSYLTDRRGQVVPQSRRKGRLK